MTEATPFAAYDLAPFDALRNATRVQCVGCGKSKRYWCAQCARLLLPDDAVVPNPVELPLKFEVFQSHREKPQCSTAGQAACLAPEYVRVWRDADKLNSQVLDNADQSVAILYPSQDAKTLSDLPNVKTLVLIDSPWTKAQVIAESDMFAGFPFVRLSDDSRQSCFWRYPPIRGEKSAFNPQAVQRCLSTIEAIHQASTEKVGANQNGQFDNLLWLYAFQHSTVSNALNSNQSRMNRVLRKSKGVLANRFDQ